jgi:hypothetical protein
MQKKSSANMDNFLETMFAPEVLSLFGHKSAGIPGASAAASYSGVPMSAAGNSSKSVQTHIGEIKVYSQATDAAGIAADMGRSMDWLFTSQANSGMM